MKNYNGNSRNCGSNKNLNNNNDNHKSYGLNYILVTQVFQNWLFIIMSKLSGSF